MIRVWHGATEKGLLCRTHQQRSQRAPREEHVAARLGPQVAQHAAEELEALRVRGAGHVALPLLLQNMSSRGAHAVSGFEELRRAA